MGTRETWVTEEQFVILELLFPLQSHCWFQQSFETELNLMNVSMLLHKKKITSSQIWFLLELITLEISVPAAVQVAPLATSEAFVCIVSKFGQMTLFVSLRKFSIYVSAHEIYS